MKSIVQEASSIAKAIERSLEKAENPRDFSIKILEYPEKNFFGLTTKQAKIALYFEDKTRKPHEPHPLPSLERDTGQRPRAWDTRDKNDQEHPRAKNTRKPINYRRSERPSGKGSAQRSYPSDSFVLDEEAPSPVHEVTKIDKSHEQVKEVVEKTQREESVARWNADMLQYSRDWLTRVLTEMHHLVPFSLEVDRFHMKIILERPLFDNPERERHVLASLSLLMLETCKHVFKVNLRDHRVVLTHRNNS